MSKFISKLVFLFTYHLAPALVMVALTAACFVLGARAGSMYQSSQDEELMGIIANEYTQNRETLDEMTTMYTSCVASKNEAVEDFKNMSSVYDACYANNMMLLRKHSEKHP